jgi:hypothetical protein
MNEPDSSKEKLMHKWVHGSDNDDTSSTESEHDFFRTLTSVRSDDDNFWMLRAHLY